MSENARILELAEQVLNSGRSPEDVCREDPELLAAVKERLTWYHGAEQMVEEIFPSSASVKTRNLSRAVEGALPSIPDYEVLEILGRGGAGIVYKARHLKLNRLVALKMPLAGEYADPIELERFKREARADAALRHPNIVQIYDVAEVDGLPFFTMELVEGGSLALKIRGGPQSINEAARMMSTLARAIQAAHQAGIVHRDLKPGNILLTNEGMPKISDFGLASCFAEEPSLTLDGTRLGTPSYMSPEQAQGLDTATGPRVDIYALGAILYEMLTGKPPFRGATALETQRLVLYRECVAPSRLNRKVPRDLETICLKCLNKSPAGRYENASVLADDLDRFLRFEPIKARRTGVIKRTAKWMRRRPEATVALAAGSLLVVVIAISILFSGMERVQVRHSIEADLKEVGDLESVGRWEAADSSLRRVEARSDLRGIGDMLSRVNEVRMNLILGSRLDAIRVSRTAANEFPLSQDHSDTNYETVFRESAGISIASPAAEVRNRIINSPVRTALLAALDDWATCPVNSARRQWILEMARQSDTDPTGWRDRLRDPGTWDRPEGLQELARGAPATESNVSILLAVGRRLTQLRCDSGALLRRVQAEHPTEFWPNLDLGEALTYRSPTDALVYFWAAQRARPEAAVSYCSMGNCFRIQQRFAEAADCYKQAKALDPASIPARLNLGDSLNHLGRFDEALNESTDCLRLDPNCAWAHFNTACTLQSMGHLPEALEHYNILYDLAPDSPPVENGYRGTLIELGRGEEARLKWYRALNGTRAGFNAWKGYPELCLFLGSKKEYSDACKEMLERFGSQQDPAIIKPLACACLLETGSTSDEIRVNAIALAEHATTKNSPTTPRLQFDQFLIGLAEYRAGHFDAAKKLMNPDLIKVMEPCTRIVQAMVLQDEGLDSDARRTLAKAIGKYDWRLARADSRDVWLCHILRREAESKIVPYLPELLNGSRQPVGNDERIIMLASLQFHGENQKCAQVFADALASEPHLMDIQAMNPGFVAACAASALSSSVPRDEASGSVSEDWANSEAAANKWLSDEMKSQMRQNRKDMGARYWLQHELSLWQQDPGLTPLRHPSVTQILSVAQREKNTAFWKALDDAITHLQSTPTQSVNSVVAPDHAAPNAP